MTLPAGTPLWRVHLAQGPYALPWDTARRFGPLERFDPHPPPPGPHPEVGVLYTATTLVTCLAEVFQATRVIDRVHLRPTATSWRTTRDLMLIDLQGQAALRLGAAESINGTARRSRTQAWARALVAAFPTVDGFRHRSAMDGGDCVCLVVGPHADGTTALPENPEFSRPLDEVAMGDVAAEAAGLLGYDVV
ncbi:RES family NAD+ phosphorylase [uncultured Pseudokineococcus sp.]|uniref:RES family NAD+ phosphorylase n=1 Tax=uncultured Pseudokineococcus sp. TaxID=1642928 RepID=UPI00261B67F8|nr:RES family NAD+ phosphorylase [uncultured Pseudokineococcus sp.]